MESSKTIGLIIHVRRRLGTKMLVMLAQFTEATQKALLQAEAVFPLEFENQLTLQQQQQEMLPPPLWLRLRSTPAPPLSLASPHSLNISLEKYHPVKKKSPTTNPTKETSITAKNCSLE